jgi:hypothetical protein
MEQSDTGRPEVARRMSAEVADARQALGGGIRCCALAAPLQAAVGLRASRSETTYEEPTLEAARIERSADGCS